MAARTPKRGSPWAARTPKRGSPWTARVILAPFLYPKIHQVWHGSLAALLCALWGRMIFLQEKISTYRENARRYKNATGKTKFLTTAFFKCEL